jgi:hypothetical protein
MPVPDARGHVVLAPCPAAAPGPAVHNGHHAGSNKQDHKGGSGGDCAFAPFHAGAALAAAPPIPPVPILAVAAPILRPGATPLTTGPPAPPPPSTGPPLLA